MKKLLIGLSVLFLMSGCDNGTDTLTCTSRSTANGLTTDTKYEIKYKDDDVKYVTITYDYNQDTNGNGTTTDNARNNDTNNNATNNDAGNTDTNNNTTNDNTNNSARNNDADGINADTDGTTDDKDTTNNNGNIDSDEVIDGAVGDTIDGVVDGVTDTILDLAGIKSTYENQMSSYDNIEGFSYDVDVDNDNEYKVVYKIDFDKISDSDLTRFNVDRDFSTIKANYEDLGYTCK